MVGDTGLNRPASGSGQSRKAPTEVEALRWAILDLNAQGFLQWAEQKTPSTEAERVLMVGDTGFEPVTSTV